MRILLAWLLFSSVAHAQYSSDIERGLFTHKFQSPNGIKEECVIGKRFPAWTYSKGEFEKALEKEAKLCSMDFYESGPEVLGVCPKLNSTNPGVLLFDLDGQLKQAFEKAQCHRGKKAEGKVLAKYKASVSCSYTPSILSYYQVSQMFGGLLKVPEATIRTMDVNVHQSLRREALEFLKDLGASDRLIGKTWRDSWGLAYKNPRGQRGRRVFTSDQEQIYGALSKNPRGEKKYTEVYGHRRNYDERFDIMKAQKPYQLVTSRKSLGRLAGSQPTESSVQTLVQMRDMADMLVLDYILGQRDRPGNIHYYNMLYYSDDGVQWNRIKMKKAAKNGPHQTAKYQLSIKDMILKDNDCGVAKGNMAKQHGLLKNLRHISPETYFNVLKFARAWEENLAEVNAYVATEWLFTDTDIKKVRSDLLGLRNQLLEACRSGHLSLDLDLARHFSGEGPLQSCELPEQNEALLAVSN